MYLRAKNTLRDQHQDDYTLMLERHAQELDTLWANYNLAVKKLAIAHNKKTIKTKATKPKAVPLAIGVICVQTEEQVIH